MVIRPSSYYSYVSTIQPHCEICHVIVLGPSDVLLWAVVGVQHYYCIVNIIRLLQNCSWCCCFFGLMWCCDVAFPLSLLWVFSFSSVLLSLPLLSLFVHYLLGIVGLVDACIVIRVMLT